MALKVGICGTGAFASCFIPLFKAHPDVEAVYLADLDQERCAAQARRFGIERTMSSLDDLCRSDVDAIALFTQQWVHGPQAIQALSAGKHVYSAVPMGVTLEELRSIVDLVARTGLIYMWEKRAITIPRRFTAASAFGQETSGISCTAKEAIITICHTCTGFTSDMTSGSLWPASRRCCIPVTPSGSYCR